MCEVGVALRERRETCGGADMRRVLLRWARRLGLKALSKLTVALGSAVGLR